MDTREGVHGVSISLSVTCTIIDENVGSPLCGCEMDITNIEVEVIGRNRRRSLVLGNERIKTQGMSNHGVSYTFYNYTQKAFRIVDINNNVFFEPPQARRRDESDPFFDRVIIVEKNTFQDRRDLACFVRESKRACEYDGLPEDSILRRKLDYYQDIVDGKISDNAYDTAYPNTQVGGRGLKFDLSTFYLYDSSAVPEEGYTYLDDLKMCIYPHGDNPAKHPLSTEAGAMDYIRDKLVREKISGILVKIVDNQGSISSRFMKSGDDVVEIRPTIDRESKDGLYRTIVAPGPNGKYLASDTQRHDLSRPIAGVYRSREDAMQSSEDRVRELESIRHERELEQQANRRLQLELEQDLLQSKRQLEESNIAASKLKAEFEVQKLANEQTKAELDLKIKERADQFEHRKLTRSDYYDERSTSRKDTGDMFKTALAIAGVAIGAFSLFKK